MRLVADLVQAHPWRLVGGAFVVGAGLAIDRRMRRSLLLTALQVGRAIAVERAKQYVRGVATVLTSTLRSRRNTQSAHVDTSAAQSLRHSRESTSMPLAQVLRRNISMTPATTRLHLIGQHDRLRVHVEACTRLAKLYLVGEDVGTELDLALEGLRDEFSAHNEAETRVIRELLHGPAAWGSLMIDRMLEEHVAEHAAFWEILQGTRNEVAARVEDLADELDAHMAAEERTFLAPATLHDHVIRVRTREEPVD
jgi:hypothetical protein